MGKLQEKRQVLGLFKSKDRDHPYCPAVDALSLGFDWELL